MEAPQYEHGWYLNTPRGLEGPYSSAQLQDQVLTGQLPLGERVYHAESDTWIAISDLFPSLAEQLPGSDDGAEKQFQPPPRPVEIKTRLHGKNAPVPSKDYLKLIGLKHQKGAAARTAPKAKGKQPPIELVTDAPAPAPTPGFMERTRELLRRRRSAQDPRGAASDGTRAFRRNVAMAASLTLICGATFALWRYRDDAQRQPAAAVPVEAVAKPTAPPPKQSMSSALDSQIGSGQNPVNRHLGRQMDEPPPSLSISKAPEEPMPPGDAPPADTPPPQEAQAYPVQHYDPATFDATNSAVTAPQFGSATPEDQPPPPLEPGQEGAAPMDPNDPSRQLAADPNAQMPQTMEAAVDEYGNPVNAPVSQEVQPGEQATPGAEATAF